MKLKLQYILLLTLYLLIAMRSVSQGTLQGNHTKPISRVFKERLDSLLEKGDTANQLLLLKKWETIDSLDPQLFLAYSHYYQSINHNDKTDLKKAISYLEKGIKLHKDRIDLRERKMFLFASLTYDRTFVVTELIEMLNYSVVNHNQWKELYDQDILNGENDMLYIVDSWIAKLYNLDNYKDREAGNILKLATVALFHYPKHREFLGWRAYGLFQKKEYANALPVLLELETMGEFSPNVLRSIANCYDKLKEKAKAHSYYLKELDQLQRLLAKSPDDPELLMDISISYNKAGDKINSDKYLQQSKKIKKQRQH